MITLKLDCEENIKMYNKARDWVKKEYNVSLLNDVYKLFNDEFNCSVYGNGITLVVSFKDERDLTMFILRWS